MVCKVAMPSSAERTSSTTAPAAGSTVQAAQAQHPVSTATRARSSSSASGRKVRRRPDRGSGRRVYGPDPVRTLAVIETGQRAGLTLDEIRNLLSASDGDQAATERLREVAVRKLPEVRELIERTEIVRDWLEAAARCECPTLDECPLFDDPALLPQKVPGF